MRLPQTIGALATFFGFFFVGWVRFAPLDFAINVIPDMFEDSVFGLLRWVLNMLGDAQAAQFLSWITSLASLPGWLLLVVIPSAQLLLRILLLSIGFFSFLYVIWSAIALIMRPTPFVKTVNILFTCIGFIQAALLIYLLPTIDSWGSAGTMWRSFSALLLGVQMGSGVWITLFGLLLSAVGNFADVISQSQAKSNGTYDNEDSSYSSFYTSN